jgi:tRNA pseudouridine13 synthase
MNPKPNNNEMLQTELPYLTANMDGIGGTIKTIPADFVVEEIPQYEFCGEGTHVLAFVQKKNMSTQDMIQLVARTLNVQKFEIGYAGRKDSRAITRQWISIEHIDPDALAQIETKNLKVLNIARHTNKLKVGHLKGNRFTIRLRNINGPVQDALKAAENILDVLSARGIPNYFGPQRFGYRGDSHLLGQAIVKNDPKGFFDTLLGRPELDPQDEFIKARILYEQGQYEAAMYAWNSALGDNRRMLKILIHKNGNLQKAFRQYDRRTANLMVSAWQSELFNRVLAKRIDGIDALLDGDVAYKHDNGACFRVENAAAEQPRCRAFDISPTGPLLGDRMTRTTGPAGDIENPLLDALDLNEDDFKRLKKQGGTGGRRPLRFRPEHTKIAAGTDEHGDYLELHFELPSGCYATVLLREITKQDN